MHAATAGTATLFDRVATAPISWGVCEVPGWGHQMEPDRVLDEMRELGFTHTELGSVGWLPQDPEALATLLGHHDLKLLAAFIPLVLHDPAQAEQAIATATHEAELLASLGARYFNTAPVTSPDWEPRRTYTTAEWDHLAAMLQQVEAICHGNGLHQVVHEHAGCVVETKVEIDWLLAETDVDVVFDTGHLAVGGYDPLQFANDHADRIGLVHLKDTNLTVAAELNAGRLSLMEAVQAGLFPALGRGDLPLVDIITAVMASGFDGWYVIEQDCALIGSIPEAGEGPVRDVAFSVAYLREMVSTSGHSDA